MGERDKILPDMTQERRGLGATLGLGAFGPTSLRERLDELRRDQERLVRNLIDMEKDAVALERLLQ